MTNFLKLLIGVVIFSLFLGGVITWLTSLPTATTAQKSSSPTVQEPLATPIPSPTPTTIDQTTSLSQTIQSLTPEDFSNDYSSLKKTANSL